MRCWSRNTTPSRSTVAVTTYSPRFMNGFFVSMARRSSVAKDILGFFADTADATNTMKISFCFTLRTGTLQPYALTIKTFLIEDS